MGRMFAWVVVAGVLSMGASLQGEDKAALTVRLRKAAAETSIDDPALKPWHLKLSFQLFDEKGKPTEEGTMEEWWAAGDEKRTYTSPSYTSTEIVSGKSFYRTSGQVAPPYLLELLREQSVHPVALDTEVKDSIPGLHKKNVGKAQLDCIMLARPMKNIGDPPLGLFPTYCLDHDLGSLRITWNYGSEEVIHNAIGHFQGRNVAVDTSISVQGKMAAKGHIEALSGMTPLDHFFDPDSTLQPQDLGAVHLKTAAGGLKVAKMVDAIYPEGESKAHINGSAKVLALIGADGLVHQTTVTEATSWGFALSANVGATICLQTISGERASPPGRGGTFY